MSYGKAVAVKRSVYISDGFRAICPQLAQIVSDVAQSPASKWTILATEDEYLAKRVRALQRQTPAYFLVIALLTPAERGLQAS